MNSKVHVKTAKRLASLHCERYYKLRMRRRLTILQPPLQCKPRQLTIWQALKAVFIQRQQNLHTARRFTIHVLVVNKSKFRVPSGNSTCVTDMAFHRGGAEHWSSNAILPGHNRGSFGGTPETQIRPMGSRVGRSNGPRRWRSRPITAAHCTRAALPIEENY